MMIAVPQRMGHEQKIEKADLALATIAKELEQVQAKLAALVSEEETIQARAGQRAADLQIRRTTIASLHSQHELTSSEASIAAGTVASPPAVNPDSLAKRLRKEEKALNDAEVRDASEAGKERVRLASIESERQHWQERAAELAHQREITEEVKARTIRALGEDLAQTVIAQVGTLQKQIEARRRVLDAARLEMDAFAEQALQELADWPDLQEQARILFRPYYHDRSTTIMEAAIRLLEALVEQGNGADLDGDLVRRVMPANSSLSEVLPISDYQLWPAFNGGNPDLLREKKAKLEQLLAEYRLAKR